MPGAQYVAGREPPSKLDRVLANPFLVPFSLASLVVGVLVLVSVVTPVEVSRSLAEMHLVVRLAVALPLLAGAPASLAGCLHAWRGWARIEAMSVERLGDVALAAGWLAYGLSVALSGNPLATVTAWIGLSMGVGYGLRVWALWATERRIRRAVEVDQALGR